MTDLGSLLPSKSYETYRLEALDWDLSCQLEMCEAEDKTATHLYAVRAPCHPFEKFTCSECAAVIRDQLDRAEAGMIRGWRCPICASMFEYSPGVMTLQPLPS